MNTKKLFKIFLGIATISNFAVASEDINSEDQESLTESTGIVLASDYETNSIYENILENNWVIRSEKAREESIRVVLLSQMSSSGNVCRFTSNFNDPLVAGCPGRAELKTETHDRGCYTYSFSYMIPESQECIEGYYGSVVQWHSKPDSHLGENWRSPPIALGLSGGVFKLRILSDSRPVNNDGYATETIPWTMELEKGIWYNFIFKINWDYRSDGNGYVKVWMSKGSEFYKSIVDYQGPTGFNDESGPYFKWGLYNAAWKTKQNGIQEVTAFFDDVIISKDKSHLEALVIQQNGYQNMFVSRN